jgi:hypothetical protein
VLCGAVIGLAVHWIRHYVQVARRERVAPVDGDQARRPRATRSTVALAWAAGFGFLGLVTEHLIAHMAAEFLRPFLASLAALLPAGMLIGWSMSHGRGKDENGLVALAFGMGFGLGIALVTGIIWTIGFGSAPWWPLIAWWGLIGLGTRLVARSQQFGMRVFDPIMAVVLVFVLTLVLNLLPSNPKAYDFFGAYKGYPTMLRLMAAEIHESPGLPATFWLEAEKRFAVERATTECRPLSAVPPPPIIVDMSPPKPISSDPLQAAIDRLARPAPIVDTAAAEPPKPTGSTAEFFRSWLVILLFAAGIGLAPWLERTLRPADYPNSETYRKDITLTIVVVLLLVGACAYARIDQARVPATIETCRSG